MLEIKDFKITKQGQVIWILTCIPHIPFCWHHGYNGHQLPQLQRMKQLRFLPLYTVAWTLQPVCAEHMWHQQKQRVADGQRDWQSDSYVTLCFAGATKRGTLYTLSSINNHTYIKWHALACVFDTHENIKWFLWMALFSWVPFLWIEQKCHIRGVQNLWP